MNTEFFEGYINYSDRIMTIACNFSVNFTVMVNNHDNQNYYSAYARIRHEVGDYLQINRDYFYFISFSVKDSKIISYYKISVYEFPALKGILNRCARWFTNDEYADLFVSDSKGNVLIRGGKSLKEAINLRDFSIQINPSIHNNLIGVDFQLGKSDPIFVEANRLIALADVLNNFNMYMAAITIVNHIEATITKKKEASISSTSSGKKKGFLERVNSKEVK